MYLICLSVSDETKKSSSKKIDFKCLGNIGMVAIYKKNVTETIFINSCSVFPWRLHINLALIDKGASGKKIFEIHAIINAYIAPGQGHTAPWVKSLFSDTLHILSIWSWYSDFPHLNTWAIKFDLGIKY